MAIPLSRSRLQDIGGGVATPRYGPEDLSPGIVHIGVGNFHRAHQAVYLDELFNRGIDRDFAIVGAGVRANDDEMRRDLMAQDWLTAVVAQEADSSKARVIAPMTGFIEPGDLPRLLDALVDPRTRIVSLTVTEGGYFVDPATQRFDVAHGEIVADAADGLARPRTAFGLIAPRPFSGDAPPVPLPLLSCLATTSLETGMSRRTPLPAWRGW